MRPLLLFLFFFIFSSLKAQVNNAPANGKVITGIASYYHNKFHGKRMANGEMYSKHKYTAASNNFPLNSWVLVTDLANNESVHVKITDRMGRKHKRVIDLSLKAAQDIGLTGRGLKKVSIVATPDYSPDYDASD